MADPIYKIAGKDEWEAAWVAGVYKGAAIDLADGYIHFSTADQLAETLNKHFNGQSGLILATIDPDLLPEGLKWEPSRGGALFPHLYAAMPMGAVIAERALDARDDGGFDLPELG